MDKHSRPAHEQHGDDPYRPRGHAADDDYFITDDRHHVTAADKPSNELHGYASRQEFQDAYRREMDDVGHALLDKPDVQNRVAAADRHARGGGRRGR